MASMKGSGPRVKPLTGPATPNPRYARHVFVCVNKRAPGHPKGCCADLGSEQIRAWFKQGVAERGLREQVRANNAGCLDQCEYGPTVVVYPDDVWYRVSTREDVDEVLDRHVIGGEIVHRLQIEWPDDDDGMFDEG